MPNPIPKLNAFVICDGAFPMPGGNKHIIVGTFDVIGAFSFPSTHAGLSLYVNFTDALGFYQVRIEFVNLNTGDVMQNLVLPHPVPAQDKNLCSEFVLTINGLILPQPGDYEFRLFADDKVVGQRRLRAVQIGPPPRAEG